MSTQPQDKAQFFPQPFPDAYCDTFNCHNRAIYFIGRPDGPLNVCAKICQQCAETVVGSIPKGLAHAVDVIPDETAKQIEAANRQIDDLNNQITGLQAIINDPGKDGLSNADKTKPPQPHGSGHENRPPGRREGNR